MDGDWFEKYFVNELEHLSGSHVGKVEKVWVTFLYLVSQIFQYKL